MHNLLIVLGVFALGVLYGHFAWGARGARRMNLKFYREEFEAMCKANGIRTDTSDGRYLYNDTKLAWSTWVSAILHEREKQK